MVLASDAISWIPSPWKLSPRPCQITRGRGVSSVVVEWVLMWVRGRAAEEAARRGRRSEDGVGENMVGNPFILVCLELNQS